MNTYYITRFKAVIVANDRLAAFSYLAHELKRKHNFSLGFADIGPNEFIQLDTNFAHAVLLGGIHLDG